MTTKVCIQCKQELHTDQFYVATQRSEKDPNQVWKYFDSYCKKCRCEYATNRRRKIKIEAVAYLGGECRDCGLRTDRVVVYDFHHKDPTQKDFSIGKQAKSFLSIKEELDKCELLCAICHRIRHDEEV